MSTTCLSSIPCNIFEESSRYQKPTKGKTPRVLQTKQKGKEDGGKQYNHKGDTSYEFKDRAFTEFKQSYSEKQSRHQNFHLSHINSQENNLKIKQRIPIKLTITRIIQSKLKLENMKKNKYH